MTTPDNIFDVYDIVEEISSYLILFELSGFGLINKTCNQVYKIFYNHRMENDIVIPYNKCYKDLLRHRLMLFSQEYNYASTNIKITDKLLAYYNTLEDIYKNYWIVLVHDLDKMEMLFLMCANMYDVLKPMLITFEDKQYYKTLELIKNEYSKYFFLDDPDKHDTATIKRLARYKGVPKYYRKRRSILIRELKKPYNLSYLIDGNVLV